jgi:hypothetical protein
MSEIGILIFFFGLLAAFGYQVSLIADALNRIADILKWEQERRKP